jgi:outer membrane protein
MISKYILAGLAFLAMSKITIGQNSISDSITIDRAIRVAIENYPSVQQAKQVVAAANAQIEQSRSAYYPEITGIGSYNRIGPVPTFTFPDLGTFDIAPHNNYDIHIGLRQSIYDFGKRSSTVELANSGHQIAIENEESIKSALAYRVADVFYAIIYLRQYIIVLDEQVKTMNQHLEITKNRLNAGTATDFDILTTKVRIAGAQTQNIDVMAALQTQEINFRQLMGLEYNTKVLLKGNFSISSININIDSLVTNALDQLPEAKLAKNAETSARIQYKLASLGDRPSLAGNLLLGLKNGYSPDIDKIKANIVVGLQLDAPLFDGFLTRAKTHQADANLKSSIYHSQELQRRITANVRQAITQVIASQEKIATTEPLVNQSEEALSLAKIRYGAGTATNLDLLDAETALSNARILRLKATYDLKRSQYYLDQAVGKIIW